MEYTRKVTKPNAKAFNREGRQEKAVKAAKKKLAIVERLQKRRNSSSRPSRSLRELRG
jgi:hypothetical protein